MLLKPGLLLTLLALLTIPSGASATPLQPFVAEYKALFDLGLPVNGTATRSLVPLANGEWQLSLEANAMIASIHEASRFRYREDALNPQLQPLEYRYQRKVLRNKRSRLVQFDWNRRLAHSDATTAPIQLPADTPVYDKASHQLPLWRDVMAGKQQLVYPVIDGDRVEPYRYRVVGEQRLETPAGAFDTLLVERDRGTNAVRQTRLWLAKTVNYLVVKLEQVEEDKHYEILLDKLD